VTFPITHPGATHIYLASVCVAAHEGETTCPATGGVDAAVHLTAADIALSNSSSPGASGFAGTLLGQGARGTQDLTFTATDAGGPGVYTVTAHVDGQALYSATPESNGGACVSLGSSSDR
jgi:hypothetical protein